MNRDKPPKEQGKMTAAAQDVLARRYELDRLFDRDAAGQRASIERLASLKGIRLLSTAHSGCTSGYARAMRYWRQDEPLVRQGSVQETVSNRQSGRQA